MNQIYATYSMMTGLLSTIAVGILLLLIISVIVITIVIWFPDDQKEEQDSAVEEVKIFTFRNFQSPTKTGGSVNP